MLCVPQGSESVISNSQYPATQAPLPTQFKQFEVSHAVQAPVSSPKPDSQALQVPADELLQLVVDAVLIQAPDDGLTESSTQDVQSVEPDPEHS